MKLRAAVAALAAALIGVVVPACGIGTGHNCAAAATVIVERGGGSGSGHSGSRSGSSSSGSRRGSGSSSSYSGSRSRTGSGSGYSGSRSNTYTNPITHTQTRVNLPSRIGTTYSYGGRSWSYHPESYWLALGLPNPYNPYDTRNYSNPNSPFYHYHLAVSGC